MSKKNSGRRVWRGVTTTTASLLAISGVRPLLLKKGL